MAPEVAIAAETPHIDTALDIIMVSSLSTFNFLQSQKAKYHTEITTIRDCNRPYDPAFKISEKIMLVPSRTRPTFTNNSVDKDLRNQSGNLNKLPINKPSVKLKITASRLSPFIVLLPAKSKASTVIR